MPYKVYAANIRFGESLCGAAFEYSQESLIEERPKEVGDSATTAGMVVRSFGNRLQNF